MSGHSKWSTIKRKKGATDAKRGKIFTKLIKEITVAARSGGGDQDANPRLRTAIVSAKAENMPKDNIERAIKKGTGELEGITYEEVYYEGYGPGGVAVLVESLTDNKNRTVADIRYVFGKSGGNLGEAGCVAWMFEKKGYFVFDNDGVDEETLMEVALEARADDVREEETTFEVITSPSDFESAKNAFDEKSLKYVFSEITMIPQSTIKLEGKEADQMIRLMEGLEDSDDVQKVYSNFDISDKTLEELGKS
ncbi:MAG: YebC/PmpR family DNA-binding transcriptional regulator [Deltaproteobacteria bacterium]|nr:YebC/PmpR family DNA-binding transcriptional regulator [Deltaproteobacteria bacterium]MBW2265897.1 YebC/PmpR family DNA-binding transcriptional regulator [Deltaproteobacteria bacterium]MBW2317936.1 YebC/PmpR family DNA-binding transcriptional regulator [Deltaproteobacteria bacterium]MBW2600747.1 YebC/PmpR family DNA-binding transcriptional regulator [Deltaproteobacteria bacterium]OEU45092.1 MAG: transcriptional regulator [Desulfobacterales bacterium S7086C20]